MAKPNFFPDWMPSALDDDDNIAEPIDDGGIGYVENDHPIAQNFNWLFHFYGLWIRYLDSVSASRSLIYDAVVHATDPSADYPDINSAVAALSANARIFVASDMTIDNQVSLKQGMEIEVKNSATISKGTILGSTNAGIYVNVPRCKIKGGIWSGFSGGTRAAIRVDTSGTQTRVIEAIFTGNLKDVDDVNDENATLVGCVSD